MDRIRTARREIHKVRSDPDREIDHAVAAGWADEAIIAFRILSYAGNYLSENPTLDRVGETIEKLKEDLYSRAFPAYADRAVTGALWRSDLCVRTTSGGRQTAPGHGGLDRSI